ncbi:uncharacterized protein FIESC28_09384 [Fusarium coffeatum]|uniref:Uncharacterized protein n=1 Tax=Fusarium coffeatum TaxID=231269 RepID=A0A366R2E3_9HYPO|nr:uncharacterized protein FIESC28_09384 [Fusarium coffeatum]RBR10678.1 hypothetical protein FIESC28_09384 [Fusarium coffeatum]
MTSKIEGVYTKSAPAPLPQFSQAVKHNGMVYCSGNIGAIPGTNFELRETVKQRAASQTKEYQLDCHKLTRATQHQAIKNLEAILIASGSSLRNAVKVNIYLTDMSKFALVNEAYDEFFTCEPKPARTCVAVYELPLKTDVEIECTAFIDTDKEYMA